MKTEAVDWKAYEELSRRTAAEGAVLLKNEQAALPLKEGEHIAVFGRCQIEYYRSGTGSGGAVHVPYSTNLLDELRRKKGIFIDEALEETYRNWILKHPFDNGGGGWAAEPWFQKDMPLEEELVKEAASKSKKAVYVIGRTAGEDKDNLKEAGSFLLTEQEKENLRQITAVFEQVIVVLNVSNLIDMTELFEDCHKDHIKAILIVWQGGMMGGLSAADVLTGDAVPCGKLPDTIAYRYEDYPSASNYGGEDFNFYQEDIYVGYRYFETFQPKKVRYEFGYGLSYTDFEITVHNTHAVEGNIVVILSVTNTGDTYSGKEVVQVYYEAPQGKLGRPVRTLAAFQKTALLKPGETEEMTITFPVTEMAAYDDGGYTGHKSCYVLEAGTYGIYVGNSVRNAKQVSVDGKEAYVIQNTEVVEVLEEALAPQKAFTRMKPGARLEDGSYELIMEEVPLRSINLRERIEERLPEENEMTGNKGYKLSQVATKEVSLETFVAQFTEEELAAIVRGEGMGHPDVTPGTASAFGGVSDSLVKYGLPLACAADGPSGIRMEGGRDAMQLPIGTLLAATWNPAIVRELYAMLGRELGENRVDTLLGPGLNIHRDPLNGRNFEYYSEDPLLTGAMAAAASGGIHDGGGHATIKHFACNNQEKRRSFVDAVVSERALREIYLRGFEKAVKEGNALSIMTSYNPVNGYYAASNYDLNTTILRKEWRYQGIVMTDWWAKMNDVVEGGEGVKTRTADMVRAQNDLYMVVNNYGAEVNAAGDDTLEALREGRLTIGELQRCAENICRFLIQTRAYERFGKEPEKEVPEILPLAESEVPENAEVHDIETEKEIPVSMEETVYIRIKENGIYYPLVSIMSPDSNLFQTAAEVHINHSLAASIQTQGTAGEWIVQKLQKCRLKKGVYSVHPTVTKPNMQMRFMEWRKY